MLTRVLQRRRRSRWHGSGGSRVTLWLRVCVWPAWAKRIEAYENACSSVVLSSWCMGCTGPVGRCMWSECACAARVSVGLSSHRLGCTGPMSRCMGGAQHGQCWHETDAHALLWQGHHSAHRRLWRNMLPMEAASLCEWKPACSSHGHDKRKNDVSCSVCVCVTGRVCSVYTSRSSGLKPVAGSMRLAMPAGADPAG